MLNVILPSVLLAFFVLLFIFTLGYPPEARLFPLLVLIPGMAMLLWEIGTNILEQLGMKKSKKSGAPVETKEKKAREFKGALLMAWLLGFILAMYIFGLLVGIAIFVFLYAKLNGGRWLSSILIPMGASVFLYGFFVYLMKEHLYAGLLGRIMGFY